MARILLIDDDEPLRTVIRLALAKLGHEVLEAADGRAGVRLFQQGEVDLVLTDIVMPDQEGLQTIFELKRKHGARRIIAMSGGGRLAPEDYLKMAQQMGAARVLSKPFSSEALARAVQEVLAAP